MWFSSLLLFFCIVYFLIRECVAVNEGTNFVIGFHFTVSRFLTTVDRVLSTEFLSQTRSILTTSYRRFKFVFSTSQ